LGNKSIVREYRKWAPAAAQREKRTLYFYIESSSFPNRRNDSDGGFQLLPAEAVAAADGG
jgi:hypothetical protein